MKPRGRSVRCWMVTLILVALLLPRHEIILSAWGLDRLTYTYADDSIHVTASVGADTVFYADGAPVDADSVLLYAEALNPDDERFSRLDTGSEEALLFDVGFRTEDGVPVETSGGYAILDYTLPDETPAGEIQTIRVFQYLPEVREGEIAQTNGVQLRPGNNSVSFATDGFSSYAVVYTVDYEYNGEIYQMPGGSAALLSQLFEQMNIERSVDEVAKVSFSDESLLSVVRVTDVFYIDDIRFDAGEGDWLLISNGTFHTIERLTVEFSDGTVMKIKVTDPEYTTELSRLLTEMKLIVNGEVIDNDYEGDHIFVRDNILYDFILSFEETDEVQFSDTESLTFTLPEAFRLPNDFSLMLDMNLGRYGKLYGNPVFYDRSTNTISITWNTEDHTQYSRLISSKSARFTLSLKGYIDLSKGSILFDQGKSIELIRENPQNATVKKEGVYNPSTNTISYTVTVQSDGTTENLILTDEMGSALVYNGDCRWIEESSANTAGTKPVITNKGSTFEISIPNLYHDDKLVFAYSAQIDVNEIAHSGNATFEETGNTVTIAGDQDPTDNTATYWENEIYFSDLTKENTSISSKYKLNGKDYRDIGWQIVTNRDAVVNFRSSDIIDTIDPEVQAISSYSGTGITVRCYDQTGALKATRVLPWSEVGVTSDSDKSFTYHIPDDDPPYRYDVDYTTKADMSQVYNQVTLTNTAYGKGGEDAAFAVVRPPGEGGIDVQKKAINVTSDHVTWQVILSISKNYDAEEFVLTEHCNSSSNPSRPWETDGLPGRWIDADGKGSKLYHENLEKVEVFGLYDGESFDVVYNGDTHNPADHRVLEDNGFKHTGWWSYNTLKMNFYKDEEHTQTGLEKPEDGEEYRTVIINITDSFPEEWPQAAKANNTRNNDDGNYRYEHINWVDVNHTFNGDKIAPRPVGTYKRVLRPGTNPSTNIVKNGKIYPIFQYQIMISGVSTDDPLVIEDTFDTDLFELFLPVQGVQMSERDFNAGSNPNTWFNWMYTYFGALDNYDWMGSDRGPMYRVDNNGATQEVTDTGLRFTMEELPKKANGSYYSFYGVEYWLIPKDETALAKIEKIAYENGGTGTFYNTASCRGETSTAQISMGMKNHFTPLDKTSIIDEDENRVTYTIEINAGKLELNEGEPYAVVDTYSQNLVLDFKSINIVCDPPENVMQVSYDFRNYKGEFKVPDNTHVTITYTADIIVETGAAVTPIENTVTALSYEKVQHDDVSLTTKTSGVAQVPGLYLFKFGSGHMERGLNGAVFQLYEFVEEEIDGVTKSTPVKVYYPDNEITQANGTAGRPITFTTENLNGRDGFVDVTLADKVDGIQLEFNKRYGLEEITTPVSTAMNGELIEYKKPTFTYLFTIGEEGDPPDYSQYKYMLGDVMTVRNEPKAIGIDIRKRFEGNCADELTEAELNSLKFTILRKTGSNPDTWGNIMTEVESNGQQISIINPNFVNIPYSDFINGYYEIAGLTVEDSAEAGIYKIEESGNEAIAAAHPSWEIATSFRWGDSNSHSDTVTITSEDVSAGNDKEVWITNSYNKETVALTAEKKWQNTRGLPMAWPGITSVVLDLYELDGTGSLSAIPVRTITLDGIADRDGEDVSGKAVFRDLPKNDEDNEPITYVVKERSNVNGYTTTYSGTSESYASFTDKYAAVTNRQKYTSVTVTKNWQNTVSDFTPPAGASVTFRLYSRVAGSPESSAMRVSTIDDVVLTQGDGKNWTAYYDYLPLVNSRGETLEYLVREVACTPSNYEADYAGGSYAKNGESILNHPALTDFKVTKEWHGTEDDDWPDELPQITLTLKRRNSVTGNIDSSFEKICTLCKASATYQGELPLNWKGETPAFNWTNQVNKYVLTATGLDKYAADGEWIYYAVESMSGDAAANYDTLYYDKNRGIITDGYATNNGYISNIRSVHDLTVSKTVEGNMGNRYQDFNFHLSLYTANGSLYNGQVDVTCTAADGQTTDTSRTVSDGALTFTLKHGESLTVKALSGGVTYTVSENNYVTEGYSTTILQDGTTAQALSASGDMHEDREVRFINTKNVLITTGVAPIWLTALLCMGVLCFSTILLLRYRRRIKDSRK